MRAPVVHPLSAPRPAGALRGTAAAQGIRWAFRIRPEQVGPAERSAAPSAADGRRTAPMARLEAVLLVSPSALTARRLAQFASLADPGEVRRLADDLNAAYDRDGSAFRIEQVADGYRLLTRPEFAPWLDRMHQRQAAQRLSPPALETLTVVAYRQPITRADIEAIRGVQSAEMLKQLMDRGLVRIVGEDDSLGRPFLYGTTREFLEAFGLRSLDELPDREELAPAAATSEDSGADDGAEGGAAPVGSETTVDIAE